MSDRGTESTEPTGEENIRNFLFGGAMLTLPFLFIRYLVEGRDFFATCIWYLKATAYVGGAIAIFVIVAMAAKKRWPAFFEKTPMLPEWIGFAGAGTALVIAIVGGFLYGWLTGLLLFWPSVFFVACLIGGFRWLVYQAERW